MARVVTLLVVVGACVIGCGRPESVVDRHFVELREQLSRVEADHDTIDQRLGALELAAADERAARRAPPAEIAIVKKPARIVQLGGGGPADDESGDPNEKTERPEIRVTGAPGARHGRSRGGKAGGRVHIEPADVESNFDPSRSSVLDLEAKSSYEAALALVQNKQYDRGLEGLNAFLVRWPDHPYAENALYWRGEAYLAQGDPLRAIEQFEAVLARFGNWKKAADALLKLGLCHERLGALARATEYWDRLRIEYPKSDAAKRIPTPATPRDTLPQGPKENR